LRYEDASDWEYQVSLNFILEVVEEENCFNKIVSLLIRRRVFFAFWVLKRRTDSEESFQDWRLIYSGLLLLLQLRVKKKEWSLRGDLRKEEITSREERYVWKELRLRK